MLKKIVDSGYKIKIYADNVPVTWKNLPLLIKYRRVLKYHQGKKLYLKDLRPAVQSARIVLGSQVFQSSKYFSNRVWMVLGCGGFYLGQYADNIEEVFEIGKDLEVFKDYEEMIDKVGYYWDKAELRREIAASGQKKVLEFHKYSDRFREMLKTAEKSV